jgi:hypothetical protein
MSRAKKVYFPKIRLQEMLNRPGGISRDQALEGAIANLDDMKGESNLIIEDAIAAIEASSAQVHGGQLSPEVMKEILEQSGQVVTLAGTFGYVALDRAARGLCDITDGLILAGLGDAAPVLVHVRALRMFAPRSLPLSKDACEQVLAELEKIMVFYDLKPIPQPVG